MERPSGQRRLRGEGAWRAALALCAFWLSACSSDDASDPGSTDTASTRTAAGGSGGSSPEAGGAAGDSNAGGSTGGGGTGETACDADEALCGDLCVDLRSSSDHCGACDEACQNGHACTRGECSAECAEGFSACGERCVDLGSDPKNCGACGFFCNVGVGCLAGVCGCPDGAVSCSERCSDLDSDPSHCGDCETSCSEGDACVEGHCKTCEDGDCACPPDRTVCDGTCVDTSKSPLHCGACSSPCTAGEACQTGHCVCTDPDESRCGERCVNLSSDSSHCGACDEACGDGMLCSEGSCRCPSGRERCGGRCVDLETDAEHCGACDVACGVQDSCLGGECADPSGDGCGHVPARNVNLTEIALYQAGKVSVMQHGVAFDQGERAADVVSGKDALVRVFVTREPAFSDRLISARLRLSDDSGTTSLFSKQILSVDSTDADPESTFNIAVPGDAIGEDTSYAVELVECEAVDDEGDTAQRWRFPESGSEPLAALSLGALRVAFVPIIANDITPDTSRERLRPLITYLESIYPFSAIETSLTAPLTANSTLDAFGSGWPEVLQQLANRHQMDEAPNDLYYYGLVEPETSVELYCLDGCVAGIGYVADVSVQHRHLRVALGISYGERLSRETVAHELGHAQGRAHAPCGATTELDAAYPYADASIGWWGFAYPDLLLPPDSTRDIMGYCDTRWISDYTYQHLIERALSINTTSERAGQRSAPAPRGHFRVLVVSQFGASWGEAPSGLAEPAGDAELATVLDAQGAAIAEVTVYRARMGDLDAASISVPAPEPGWHAISIDGIAPVAFE